MSTLNLSNIQGRNGTGDITVATGNRLVIADAAGFSGYNSANGSIVQVQQTSTMPTSHITTATTSEASVPLIASITPKFSSSRVHVEFYTGMSYGVASGPLVTILYRRIDGGAWTVLTPHTAAASRYAYGWSYMGNSTWFPCRNLYVDYPNTTGFVEYVVNYRLSSGSGTSYLVHQYMEYGYVLTEIM